MFSERKTALKNYDNKQWGKRSLYDLIFLMKYLKASALIKNLQNNFKNPAGTV